MGKILKCYNLVYFWYRSRLLFLEYTYTFFTTTSLLTILFGIAVSR